MSAIAFLRQLLSDGLNLEAALIAADRFEQRAEAAETARVASRRVKDAARKQAQRLRECHAESRGHAVTSRDSAGPAPHVGERPQVVTPSLPSLRSEELGGGGVEARALAIIPVDDWPAGSADAHAKLLVAEVASPWLDPNKSPDLVTTRGRLAAWRRDGASWESDVLPVVTGLCANRRGKVASWKYFDDAVARSISDNRAALEIPEATSVVRLHATGPPRTIDEKSSASWDYAMKRIAEDGQ